MADLSLVFDILARDRASSEFDKVGRSIEDVGDKGNGLGSRLSSGIGSIGKVAGAAALGGVAVLGAGLVSAFKGGLDEMNGNQVALAQFEAGVKQTGGVANITAQQMQGLADSIEAKTGTDGAAVVSGGALLATFTKVRNEVGAGNDVFNRATQAGVDLAARGFGSVESNAVLLGKALNDPIKGLAALGKQGVTFTEGQKETIKSLVATGDTLGAQKLILAEVEAQVGGSAEAYGKTLPGQTDRARAALDGVKESLVKGTMPAFTGLLEGLNGKVFPALSDLAGRIGPAVSDFLQDKLKPALAVVGEFIVTKVVPAFKQVASFIADNVLPVFQSIAGFIVGSLIPAVVNIAGHIAGGLRAAFETINEKINQNRPQLESLGNAFKAVADFVVSKVVPLLGPVLGAAFTVLGQVIGTAVGVIGGIVKAFTAVKDTATTAVRVVIDKFLGMVETIVEGAATAFGWVPGLGPKLKDAAAKIGGFRDSANAALNGVKDVRIEANTAPARQATQALLDYINSREGTVRISGVNGVGGITERALGGPLAAGQMSWVGERGPELVSFDRAAYVHTAADSARLAGSGTDLAPLLTEVAGLRGDVQRLVRDAQTAQRQMAGA